MCNGSEVFVDDCRVCLGDARCHGNGGGRCVDVSRWLVEQQRQLLLRLIRQAASAERAHAVPELRGRPGEHQRRRRGRLHRQPPVRCCHPTPSQPMRAIGVSVCVSTLEKNNGLSYQQQTCTGISVSFCRQQSRFTYCCLSWHMCNCAFLYFQCGSRRSSTMTYTVTSCARKPIPLIFDHNVGK